MAKRDAARANIAAGRERLAGDERAGGPAVHPLTSAAKRAAADGGDAEGLGPMSPGMADRIRRAREEGDG